MSCGLWLLIGCGPLNPPELLGPGSGNGAGAGGTSIAAVSFATDVMPVFKTSCAGCHQGQYEDPAITFGRLRGTTTATAACPSTPRIVISDGANSLLVKKLLGTAGCGQVMPLIRVSSTQVVPCSDSTCVAPEDIEKVKRWIDQGALDN